MMDLYYPRRRRLRDEMFNTPSQVMGESDNRLATCISPIFKILARTN